MAKSSINFQKTKANSVDETKRIFEAKYLLPKEVRKENEYWDCGKSDAEVFKEEFSKAKPKGGRKPKLENSLWEAVVNLNENHNMQNAKKVTELIEKKFNIKCTRIAIHRDEGKVFGEGENRTVKYNYHAHLNFCTYKDSRQNWRRQLIKRKDLSALQTKVAELLEMERGKVNSTAVRANHRELRQNYDEIMEQRQVPEFKLTVTALKKEITNLRNEMKKKNAKLDELGEQKVYTQDDYVALNALKKELNKSNLQEIYQEFLKLQKQLKSKDEQLKLLRSEKKEIMDALTPTYTKMVKRGENPPKYYKDFICFVDKELSRKEEFLSVAAQEYQKQQEQSIKNLKEELEKLNKTLSVVFEELKELKIENESLKTEIVSLNASQNSKKDIKDMSVDELEKEINKAFDDEDFSNIEKLVKLQAKLKEQENVNIANTRKLKM